MATSPNAILPREAAAARGKTLEVLTILWAGTEASVALWSAARTGSVSMRGFGWDSLIEVVSALAVWWRLSQEMDSKRRRSAEHLSLCITGICLVLLAVYVFVDSVRRLLAHRPTESDWAGVAITIAALVCMPALAWAKRRVAVQLNSRAMATDAQQTNFCMYQAAIVLGGLLCYRLFGIWWADSVAGLVLVPILALAASRAFRGESCGCIH